MSRESVVELVDASRVFATPGGDVAAVRSASLSVAAGEMVAVMGRSGSGKSTLLNLVGLLDRPTTGRYLLGGADTSALGERERSRLRGSRIGFVFQAFHLIEHKSVVANVALPLVYSRAPRRGRRERVLDVLDQVGMSHRVHARPDTLSGGERQRIAVARAVVHRPRLLLCDEPTGNLDSAHASSVTALLRELADAHDLAVVLVTHDEVTAGAADRILRLRDGVLKRAP